MVPVPYPYPQQWLSAPPDEESKSKLPTIAKVALWGLAGYLAYRFFTDPEPVGQRATY